MLRAKRLFLPGTSKLRVALHGAFAALLGLWLGFSVLYLVVARFGFFEQIEGLQNSNTLFWANVPSLILVLVQIALIGSIVALVTRSPASGISALIGLNLTFKPWTLGSGNSSFLAVTAFLVFIALATGSCIVASRLQHALIRRLRHHRTLVDNIHVVFILGFACYWADLFARLQEGMQSWVGKPSGMNALLAPVAYKLLGRIGTSVIWGDPGFAAALWWWPLAIIAFRFWLRRMNFHVLWHPFALLLVAWALALAFLRRCPLVGPPKLYLSLRSWAAADTIAAALKGPYAHWIDPAFAELGPWLGIHFGWLLLFLLAAFWPLKKSVEGARTVLETTRDI